MNTFYPAKLYILSLLFTSILSVTTIAQVGIGNTSPNANSLLEIGDGTDTKGVLLPRVALTGTNNPSPLATDVAGMIVYNTATNGAGTTAVTPGFYYNDGTDWVRLANTDDWKLTGNAGTVAGTNFVGTSDGVDVVLATNGSENMRLVNGGQVSVNDPTPFAGDRFSSTGATNDDAINGYTSGTGNGVYGSSTLTGNGVRGVNNGTGIGVIGFSANTGTGVQGQNSGTGAAIAAFNTGAGDGIYNETANGWGIVNFIGGNNVGIFTDLTDAGGTGEYIDLDGQDGSGIIVNNTTASDVYAFRATVNTATPTAGTVNGTVLGGSQTGVGHGIILTHSGTAGRNAEFNITNASNPDPAIFSVSLGDGSVIVGQNQNNSLPGTITVADFSYTGTDVDDHIGVSGYSNPAAGWGIGVEGSGGWYGVLGIDASGGGGYGVFSSGDFGATGAKFFVIDHPDDPANKYLRHANIESNEILNLYRGTATFDANGRTIIQLPEYYNSINKNASYQLTAIGAAMPNLFIEKEVNNSNTFVVAGGISGKKVSWILTAERNDPYLQQNPEKRENVVDKGDRRGKYLTPQLYNQPKESGMFYKEVKKLEASKPSAVKYDKSKLNTVKAEKIKDKSSSEQTNK